MTNRLGREKLQSIYYLGEQLILICSFWSWAGTGYWREERAARWEECPKSRGGEAAKCVTWGDAIWSYGGVA